MLNKIIVIFLSFYALNAAALTVGVTAGPHVLIMEEVRKQAKAENIDLKIIEFNDFIMPNAALNDGDIDFNSYQHQPFLDEQIASRGYKLVSIAKTIILPLGIYSTKYKDLNSVNDGATIALPNDPTNLGRALNLLKKANLIESNGAKNPSILDITANPKKLKLVELEAPQIPRILADVDYGITNTDWIMLAGIDPNSAFLSEDKNSPYANIIVTRIDNQNNPEILRIIEIYHSDYIKNYILTEFKGAVLPAW